jgi:hypothetical protein
MKRIALLLGLSYAALAQQHSTVPVVLVDDFVGGSGLTPGGDFFRGNNNYYLKGCDQPRSPNTSFGDLPQMIYQDAGRYPLYFDYCQQGPNGYDSILGSEFGQFLTDNAASLNTKKFGVIAYGLGGLIVRAYLAGAARLPDNGLAVPISWGFYDPSDFSANSDLKVIRKLVLIGAPNLGFTTAAGMLCDWLPYPPDPLTCPAGSEQAHLYSQGISFEQPADL